MLVLGDVLRALEHDVLEQVGEPRALVGLVLGADLVPDDHGHLGDLVVLVQDHLEPVRQRVLLERQSRQVGVGRGRRDRRGGQAVRRLDSQKVTEERERGEGLGRKKHALF